MSHVDPSGESEAPVVILGGGLAGISAALHLKRPWLLIERADRLGGLAKTESRDGYSFDHTGHWLHLRTPYFQEWVRHALGDRLVEVERIARIYSHGAYTLYPFQANLHGLPPEVVYECLTGAVQAKLNPASNEPRNFDEYIRFHFGDGIAKHFMIPYNTKLWGVPPSEISSAWCQRFVPRPNIDQVIAGAVGAGPSQLGYNIRFFYPREGGIETFTRAIAAPLPRQRIMLDTTVEAIDLDAKEVHAGGLAIKYAQLISTIPLPNLVGMITQAPEPIHAKTQQLRATPVHYLNLALRCKVPFDFHWVYVPEERFPFYRVGVFSNAVPAMAPPGCSSLYVELSDRNANEGPEKRLERVVAGLIEMRILRSAEDIQFADLRTIDPAYVIFDAHYERTVTDIHGFLEAQQIYSRGRYGEWIYNAMEDSLVAGKAIAEHLNA